MQIIGGKFKKRKLFTPKGIVTRPTSNRLREALFNICQSQIEGAEFLDLFAGSGAMGIEALSRGAQFATFIDNNREAMQTIRRNIELLDIENITEVLFGNVFTKLKRIEGVYTVIYADPPYNTNDSDQIIKWVDKNLLLEERGILFVEDAKKEHFIQLDQLEYHGSRKYGKTYLHQFRGKS